MSNIPSSSMLDALNVIKSLICFDPLKRAIVFDVSMYRLFRGKIKESQDEIWIKKVNTDELEKRIGLSALNPLLTVEYLLEQRKLHAISDVFEKSFDSALTVKKGN